MTIDLDKDNLEVVLADIWRRLVRGKADRRSAFHTPVVSTVSPSGVPEQRVMVLREVNQSRAAMRFHTDNRTAKCASLTTNTSVSVLGYDVGAKIQIRVTGNGRIETQGGTADQAWHSSVPSSRRCYVAEAAPGAFSAVPTSGLPASVENRVPDIAETEIGRENFAVLMIEIDQLEWLYLAHDGHRRARFVRNGNDWVGNWLIP